MLDGVPPIASAPMDVDFRRAIYLGSVLTLLGPTLAATQEPAWPFDRFYDSDVVYLHPLVSFALSPFWERDWERSQLSHSGIRLSAGSVTTHDLLTESFVNVNQPLGDTRYRFLYFLDWFGGQHLDVGGVQQFMGFEASVVGPLGVLALAQPEPNKEHADMAFGVVLAGEDRESYLRASVRFDDFLYDDKNDRGGESIQESVSLQWTGRYAKGRWEGFTSGRLSSPSERVFPDTLLSPDITGETRVLDRVRFRGRYLTSDESFVELGFWHYGFEDGQMWRNEDASYDYRNRLWVLSAHYAITFGDGAWRAWPGVRVLFQEAAAEGFRTYDFSRTDWMPSAFVEYFLSPSHSFEVGYMASASDRTLEELDPEASFAKTSHADKVKGGWTYHFSPLARIQLSLSHRVSVDKFGGGNVQFVMFF